MDDLVYRDFPRAFLNFMSKFIFVTSKTSVYQLRELSHGICHSKIQNAVVVYEKNSMVNINVQDFQFCRTRFSVNALAVRRTEISRLFPSQIQGYIFRVLYHLRLPFAHFENNILYTAYNSFVSTFCKKYGLKMYAEAAEIMNYAERIPEMRELFDLILTNALRFSDMLPSLMVYEELAACILVPLPQRTSIVQLIFFMPFDKIVWFLLIGSIIFAMVCWKFLSTSDSCWRFLWANCANIVDQSVSMHSNRLVLIILLQTFVFATLYVRLLYEGLVTSVMSERFEEKRFTKIDEVFTSDLNFTIYVTETFGTYLLQKYDYLENRLVYDTKNTTAAEFAEDHSILVTSCEIAELAMNQNNDENPAWRYYYVLDEKLQPYFQTMDVYKASPYLEKLQELMDRCFESGLTNAWRIAHRMSIFGILGKMEPKENNAEPLKLEDVQQIFYILPIGWFLALLVFIGEILYQKTRHISMTWLKIVMRRKFSRRIRVRPINVE